MLRKIEKTAKNVNEAVEAAAKELGVSVEEVGYEVIRESNKGLMKLLLGSEVEISAWLKKDEPKEVKKPKKEEKPVKKAVEEKKEDQKEQKTDEEHPAEE